jgi:hypothetical protein
MQGEIDFRRRAFDQRQGNLRQRRWREESEGQNAAAAR